MLVAVDGPKGSGKTNLVAKLLKADHDNGRPLASNFKLLFCDNFFYWHALNEIYGLRNCSIGIDEGQRLFEARRFMSLPPQFAEMVAGDRHDHVNIYATTQNILHIDKRVRDNIDVLFSVRRFFRFPFGDTDRHGKATPAIIQISRYWEMQKRITPSGMTRWTRKKGHWLIISKFKQKLYETYEKITLSRYLWKIQRKAGKTKLLIVSRSMVESGKSRI